MKSSEQLTLDVGAEEAADAAPPTVPALLLGPTASSRFEDVAQWRLSDFDVRETVGMGSSGRVRLAVHKNRPDTAFALKAVKKRDSTRDKAAEHLLREPVLHASLEHPFITPFIRGFADEHRVYMLTDLAVGGELFNHLRGIAKFPVNVARFYAAEIALAIEYLHKQGIVFRDLNPDNLLIAADGHLRLTDLGLARRVDQVEECMTVCGVPEYRAPEMITNRGYGTSVDWWAFGVLLYEMLVGYPPFFDESPIAIFEKILTCRLHFPKWVDPRGVDLIRGLLQPDPTKRLGCLKRGSIDVRKHKFFSGVDWDLLLARRVTAPIVVRATGASDARYFDRYPESASGAWLRPLKPEDQQRFANFGLGAYAEGQPHPPGFDFEPSEPDGARSTFV